MIMQKATELNIHTYNCIDTSIWDQSKQTAIKLNKVSNNSLAFTDCSTANPYSCHQANRLFFRKALSLTQKMTKMIQKSSGRLQCPVSRSIIMWSLYFFIYSLWDNPANQSNSRRTLYLQLTLASQSRGHALVWQCSSSSTGMGILHLLRSSLRVHGLPLGYYGVPLEASCFPKYRYKQKWLREMLKSAL